MKKGKESKVSEVQAAVNELLSLMGSKAKATISEDKENEAIRVDIDAGDEAGLLIGRRGETLSSIQTVLGMALRAKRGEWTRVIVNVGDWREKQEDYLKELAQSAAQKAKDTGEPQPIYNLSPGQRRVVHLALSSDSDIETESTGEGEERYLIVKPKTK